MRQKILFISDHGDPLIPLGSKQAGGQNNYVKHLALELDRQGYSVDIVTHWSDETRPAIEPLGEHSCVYRFAGGQKGFVDKNELFTLLPAMYEEMAATLSLVQYDVVHTHYWLSGVLATFMQKQYTFNWIHTNHSLAIAKEQGMGLVDERRKRFEIMIMQQADTVLATTENEKHQIEALCPNIHNIVVAPIGVSPIYLQANEQSLQFDFPYFFYAGRLEESKGIYDLLKAFRYMLKKHLVPANTKLVIAGGCAEMINIEKLTPKERKLRQAIKGIEHRVLFVGPKKDHQLKALYANAVATVMPSHYESFGMVAAEAQACGCPVIATRVGGLKDVVKSGITGFHFPKSNIPLLSEQMAYFLKHPTRLLKMRHAAKEFAKREYNWTYISQQLKGLYSQHVSNV